MNINVGPLSRAANQQRGRLDYDVWDRDHPYYEPPPEAFLGHPPERFKADV